MSRVGTYSRERLFEGALNRGIAVHTHANSEDFTRNRRDINKQKKRKLVRSATEFLPAIE